MHGPCSLSCLGIHSLIMLSRRHSHTLCHLQNSSVRPSFLYSNNPVVNDHWSWFKRALTYNVSSVGIVLVSNDLEAAQAMLCSTSAILGPASSAATRLD